MYKTYFTRPLQLKFHLIFHPHTIQLLFLTVHLFQSYILDDLIMYYFSLALIVGDGKTQTVLRFIGNVSLDLNNGSECSIDMESNCSLGHVL